MTATALLLSRRRAWVIAVVATLAMSVSFVDRQVLAALATSVKTTLGLNHEAYGWLQSGFALAYLVGSPLAGRLVDRGGARLGLLVAVVVWSLVAAGQSLAASFGTLFALRIALGLAESPSFPGAAQTVRRTLPPADQPAGFGLLFTGSSFGAMVAAPLAIALKERLGGWREAFVATALIGLLWVPLWLLATRAPGARAALAPAQRRGADGPWSALLRDPAVLRAMVLTLGSAPGILFILAWMPQYLQHAFKLGESDVAKYVWMPPVAFDLGAVAFGALASRRARGAAVTLAMRDLVAIGALMQAALVLLPVAPSAGWAVAIASVSLAGGGAVYARMAADMLVRVSPSRASSASGLTAAAQSLAQFVTSPIVGRVIDRTHSYNSVAVVIGLLVIPAATAWIFWPMRSESEGVVVG